MRTAVLVVAVVALSACGGDAGQGPADAASGSQDAPPAQHDASIDAAARPVTVSITGAGVARVGVHVIVTRPDLGDGGAFDTDATGAAQPMIEPGSSITAVNPFDEEGTNLYTVTDVQPGDVIAMTTPFASTTRSAMTVTLPTFPSAAHYFVYTACGTGTPDDVELFGCGATTPLLALALDAQDHPIASFWIDHAPVGATLDLHASAFAALATQTYAFANIPATTLFAAAWVSVADEGIVYAASAAATPSAGSASITLAEPASIGRATSVVDATYVATGGTLHHAIGAFTSLDFARPLPDMSAATTTDENVRWTATPSASGSTAPDAAIATVHRDDGDVFRHVVGPVSVVLDTETDLLGLPPVPGFDLTGTWTVLRLETAKAGGGEAALRQKGLAGDYAFAADGTTSLVAEYKD